MATAEWPGSRSQLQAVAGSHGHFLSLAIAAFPVISLVRLVKVVPPLLEVGVKVGEKKCQTWRLGEEGETAGGANPPQWQIRFSRSYPGKA